MNRTASKVFVIAAAALVTVLVAVACSGDAIDDETDDEQLEPVIDTLGSSGGSVLPASADGDHTEVTDVAFLTLDGVEFSFDIRFPANRPGAQDEPRPIVILFHGFSSAGNRAADAVGVAAAAADAGMVVFTPEWIIGDPFPLLLDDVDRQRMIGNCAVAVAQEQAGAFGGDPARTVTAGFSAGTGPALVAAVRREPPVDGCAVSSTPQPVVGAMLGDGEYFWQSEPFDGAFARDLTAMRYRTAALIDPSRWPLEPPLRLRLWAAADGTAPRAIDPAADGDDWLSARDPDGSIRADLRLLGALDDDRIDYLDNSQLLTQRAAQAGVDTELVVFPGGHTTGDKIPELVTLLLSAAAES